VPEPLLFGDGLGARVDRCEIRTLLAEVRDKTSAQEPFDRLPQRGRSYAATLRKQERQDDKSGKVEPDDVDPNGVAF
jgi:hypothetical protein